MQRDGAECMNPAVGITWLRRQSGGCPLPALAASEHNTAVVGVMMEVCPVSELPRVLTQENDLWLQKIKTSKLQTQSF